VERRIRGALAIWIAGLAVAGCGGTVPASRYYVLDYEVTQPTDAEPLPVVLGVDVFGARPLYRDRRIAYRISGHELAYYPYRFWAADPAELVASQLADQLRRRHVARAVLEQPFDMAPDWLVAGRVQRFEEVDRGDHWAAVCELAVRIETAGAREVLVERTVHREIATTERTPEAVARAMSEAVRQLGVEIETLLRETSSP
jgi:uncharacterized lipoprotein YmbA